MANVLQIPIPVKNAALVWPARSDPTVNTILLINQDLNNSVYIGQQSSITVSGQNTIPVPPNGSISVDPASPWYVIGAVAGITPLVMVPNGQANFRALTQGLGALAIPAIFSPNFIAGVSGWSVDQDGSAEFNNLTIRGTFLGNGFILNSNGFFLYSGTPANGNLLISITSASGNDQFGNFYQQGVWIYDNFGNATGLVPGGNGAASQLALAAGNGTPMLVPGCSALFANANGELIVNDVGDGQTYSIERKTKGLGTGTIGTSPATLVNFTVSARTYRISARIFFTAGGAGTQTAGFIFNCSGASVANGIDITVKRATSLFGATFTATLNATVGVTATLTAGNTYVAEIEGLITFGNGGLNVQMIVNTGTASLVGGYVELKPV